MKNIFICIIYVLLPFHLFSQSTLKGMVMTEENGNVAPLPGANVHWLNTNIGATTDLDGWFEIEFSQESRELVISYVGYQTDTITVATPIEIHHILKPQGQLDEVTIQTRKRTSFVSYTATANVSKITSEELLKAACCNLSESFETNPSIDVNFSDAVTGTKQINMLGLNSPYILIAQENIPNVRGASQAYGLTFTPGTWVESIQITKGAGSVVNGFESIAGQINAELVKPATDDQLFINAYGSLMGRLELNTHFNHILNDKWSTGIYVHGNHRSLEVDQNDDGFLDVPLADQINVMNRWQYQNLDKGWVGFFNVRYMGDSKQAGQTDFNPDTDKMTTNAWGSEIDTRRFDTALKIGYVYPEIPYQSWGFQTAYSFHEQEAYYGLRTYDITHNSMYSSLLFNSIIGDTRSKFKTGLTLTYDKYDEVVNTTNYGRAENSIGGFFEYSFDNVDDFSITAGIRADQHNVLGFFVTPRVHARYAPWEKGVLRASAGKGKRSASIFAENQQLFASNRAIMIENTGDGAYGLDPETAWNYGVSFLQGFNLFGRKGDVIVDYYLTNFTNQVVVDWENPQEINFYNLDGDSNANSFQVELSYEPFDRFDVKTSYKYYDITTDYKSGNLEKSLIPKHRFFANLGYQTEIRNNSNWKFDVTYNWVGEQRFPFTGSNPEEFQKPEYSGVQNLLNFQVTKVFSPKFEVYVGGENITNTTQDNPIVSADNPFGPYFDSTMIYAPINGANYYTGLRFKIN